MDRFVVYAHYTCDESEIFYVGEGSSKRAKDGRRRSNEWKKISLEHGGFTPVVLAVLSSKEECIRLETTIISGLKKRGYKLANKITNRKGWKNPKLAQWNREHAGEKSPVYGLKRPDLVERNKKALAKRAYKSVKCKETGKEYISIIEATLSYTINKKSTSITKVLRGTNKRAFGYTWEYVSK